MKRLVALASFAVGALSRRRARAFAITSALAVVVAVSAATLFVTDALRAEVAAGARHLPDLTVQRLVAGRPATLPVALGERVRAMPSVAGVRARAWGYVYVPPIAANAVVMGASAEAPSLAPIVSHGRALRRGETGAAIVGARLADALGVAPGDELALRGAGGEHLLRVTGTFDDASALRTADLVVTSDGDARQLLGLRDDEATDLAVRLVREEESTIVALRITGLDPALRVIDARLVRRSQSLTVDARSGLLLALLLPALVAFLLLAWDRLTGVSEAERREIGILKTVGWETSDVLVARVCESLVIALVGTATGIVLAYVWAFPLGAPGLASTLLGWSVLLPDLALAPRVDASQLVALLAGVVVPFVCVSLVPAWRAATIDPDRAMRGGA